MGPESSLKKWTIWYISSEKDILFLKEKISLSLTIVKGQNVSETQSKCGPSTRMKVGKTEISKSRCWNFKE